jgi:single-strand DNA-binding protein
MTIIATITGNVVADVEPRISQAGKPWCSVRVASTPREKDRQSGEWRDGETMFVSIVLFGDYADHAVQSLSKGVRVTATGKLRQRSYTDNQGAERVSVELYDVEAIGPELRWASAQVTRAQQGGSGGGFGPSAGVGSPGEGFGAQGADPGFGNGFDEDQHF